MSKANNKPIGEFAADAVKVEAYAPRRLFKITTPVPTFSGTRHDVRIREGNGDTSDLAAALACRAAGYRVVELVTDKSGKTSEQELSE